tara:strand:- start:607 stop:831 length:225 start_codon:yes stop_codon:yes gene_type:complete
MKTVDLHGKTLHEAWKIFMDFAHINYKEEKYIRVITGQGAIQKEFPSWCEACNPASSWETEPHNPGSWKVELNG